MTTTAVHPATARRWWATLDEHRHVGGRCPRCGTPRRCRPWADAFAELVAHDLYHLGPPPTDDRPQPASGGARRTA